MISYEELDRALARWKSRKSGVAVPDAPQAQIDSAATPLPIPAEELGSIPHEVSPGPGERTGEIDVNELVESYDEAD